jgi:acyl carrier protein
MTQVSAGQVRAFVLASLEPSLEEIGLSPDAVQDSFDLHDSGVIDSFGLIELVAAVEEAFSLDIDFEDLDPDDLTVVGTFCRYVEERSQNGHDAP